MFKKTFQETLLIPTHAVARGGHKAVINKGFHRYLNKVKKLVVKGQTLPMVAKAYYLHCMLGIQAQ